MQRGVGGILQDGPSSALRTTVRNSPPSWPGPYSAGALKWECIVQCQRRVGSFEGLDLVFDGLVDDKWPGPDVVRSELLALWDQLPR